jgi:uncharacterized protein (TIGR03435 family)
MKLLALIALAAQILPAQSAATPAFEVATIKPSTATGVSQQVSPSGLFTATGNSLNNLIKFAYDVHPSQIIGGPGWLENERFDVIAKPDTPGKPSLEHLKAMVRQLLADRFHLTFHREKKELSVYAITIAKSGPKLFASDGDPNGLPRFGVGPRNLTLTNATMADFANILQSSILDRPAVDHTGLGSKRYDLNLKWMPDRPEGADKTSELPDLYTAFQEQLGLKLEAIKTPTDVMVIDRVEHPSPN